MGGAHRPLAAADGRTRPLRRTGCATNWRWWRKSSEQLAPFRLLTGIECDILLDGSLDQEEELLAGLDVVVASVHSILRMPRAEMTRRMLARRP